MLIDGKLLLRSSFFLLDGFVAEVQADIGSNHNEVGPIEPEGQVKGAGHKLGDEATDVTKLDEDHEEQALALGRAGAHRTDDGQRPRNTKRNDHNGLKDTSQFHVKHFSFYAFKSSVT